MLSLILVLAVGQTAPRGPVAVVIDSKRPGADAFAAKVSTRTHSALVNLGLDSPMDNETAVKKLKAAGYSDPRNCQAAVQCLGRLAKLLGPKGVVVGVDVAKIAKSLAVHLEAVSAEGESLAVADLSGSSDGWLTEMGPQLDQFAKQVSDKVLGAGSSGSELKEPKAQNDTGTTTGSGTGTTTGSGTATASNSEPFIPPPPPPPAPEPEKKSRIVPLSLGVGALVCFVASGVTLGLGMSNKAALDNSKIPGLISTSSLTRDQAMSYASTGNAEFTVSLITVIVGALLAAGAATLFVF